MDVKGLSEREPTPLILQESPLDRMMSLHWLPLMSIRSCTTLFPSTSLMVKPLVSRALISLLPKPLMTPLPDHESAPPRFSVLVVET